MPKYTVNGEEICYTRNDLETGSYRVDSTTGAISQAVDAELSPELSGSVVNTYNEITSIAASTTTSLVTYTVPVNTTAILSRIQVSGSNIATYEVLVDAAKQAKKRTYFGGSLNEVFEFGNIGGLSLTAGQVVLVRVTHSRPMVGDFEGRIQVTEI